MSNLSELLPAGGAAKEFEPVASGTLPNGRAVVLKSNGQVEILGESTGVGIQIPLGTSTQFNNANSQYIAIAYNPNTAGQFVIAWKNYAAGNLVAVLGTVSGTNLTFGSITQIIAESVVYNEVLFDPNTANRFLVVGTNEGSSNRGSAWVGTISGSSLSFSAEMYWNGGGTSVLGGAAFDPTDAGHFITTWYDGNNSNYGTLVTGYVSSATNINYYTEVVFHSAYVSSSDIAFAKSNEVFVVAYRGSSSAAYGRIGVRTSNSATLYTAATFSTNNCTDIRVAWDKSGSSWNDGKIIITYEDNTNGDYRLVLGTVNSSTYAITFGTPIVITTEALYPDIEFDPSTLGRFIITYGGKVRVGTISGTTITLGTEIIYQSPTGVDIYGTQGYVKAAFDTAAEDGRFVIASRISQEGKAILSDLSGTVVTTNLADFVGITAEAITSGATGVVVPQGGIVTTLSNLNIGDTYYLQSDGSVHSVSIPYDLANAVFVDSFSISSQQTEPGGVAFSTTGDKMFVIGDTPNNFVSEYALSTSFDVSTASFTHNSMTINSQEAQAQDLAFNTDGTKMFVVGSHGDEVNEYALSTGFNVSTASFTRLFSLASQEVFPTGIAFNTNGTKMFIVGETGDDVNEYALSTGFNISTASFTDSFSVASQDDAPSGIAFNADGTKMFIVGRSGVDVNEYSLSTGFDVSTSSYSTRFSVSGQESQPQGIAFSSDGKKMFIVGRAGNDVNEYTTSPASTSPAVNIGKAISTTSLILKG